MRIELHALLMAAVTLPLSMALNCLQCNGWSGFYPPALTTVPTCDNLNNQCQSNQFCVKIVDRLRPGTHYTTYKSDCFYQTQLQVNPTNLSTIVNGLCYPFQDGSTPVKRWWYCFCNDRDYCNGRSEKGGRLSLGLLALLALLILRR